MFIEKKNVAKVLKVPQNHKKMLVHIHFEMPSSHTVKKTLSKKKGTRQCKADMLMLVKTFPSIGN